MSAFDLIHFFSPLNDGEQYQKKLWMEAQRLREGTVREHIHSLSEERIFGGMSGNVVVRKHERYSCVFEHKHDFFELIYIAQGECQNRIESETLRMTEGNFCLIAPGVRHTMGVFSDEGIVINIIIRKSTFDRAFRRMLDGENPLSVFFLRSVYATTVCNYLLFRTARNDELYSYVNRIVYESLREDKFTPMIMENLVITLFWVLLRDGMDVLDESALRHPTADAAANIINCIYEIGPSVTLSEVASRVNYTEAYISTLIRKVTGMTFKSIVTQIRIRKAKELLLTTELHVNEIAKQSGFSSVEHFCRTFRRITGITPTGYRSGTEI